MGQTLSIGSTMEQSDTQQSGAEYQSTDESAWAYRFVWGIGVALLGLVMTALFTGADASEALPTMTGSEQSSAFIYVAIIFVMMAAVMGVMWMTFSNEQKTPSSRASSRRIPSNLSRV